VPAVSWSAKPARLAPLFARTRLPRKARAGTVADVVAPPLGRDASTGPTLLLRYRDEVS
jgi:hypothetical protein